jgi:hypothetical protein
MLSTVSIDRLAYLQDKAREQAINVLAHLAYSKDDEIGRYKMSNVSSELLKEDPREDSVTRDT